MAGVNPTNPQNPNPNLNQMQPPPPSSIAATLLIRHLPEAIPQDTLSRLFSHYGASSVRPCSSNGRLRNCAFLDFQNEALAFQAHRQLNGLRFLGKVLKAEKASKQPQNDDDNKAQPGSHEAQSSVLNTCYSKENASEQVSKSGSLPALEPIAPRLGVDYPFPPYLEYAYPPPDGNILTNIVNALIAVPRFYTQVLHLMNKMNIPAPFRMAMPTPPLPPLAPVPPPPPPPLPLESAKQSLAESSSEESEMESSDEDAANVAGGGRGLKRARREAIVGPAVDKDVAHETVGLKSATLVPKERPVIKKRNPVMQIKLAHKAVQREHNDDEIAKEADDLKSEDLDINKPYASPEEIQGGKLGLEELLSLPVFKNYKTGNPAPVLYIKNLAKDVVADDFYYIFGSLFGSTDLAKSNLSVKLMQEGRMRGQAFLTFPSVELAHNALNLVNGYEFKGKPMVIQFGRNPAAAKEK
ncbi:U11/U12 small nuclear ribonucleoprotein 65 kDa protein [Cannabis sativa]|uniref:U11/U12 small nuclear ribonucleoprotein 65 kDa protein n=1 Tax=Cannabis sativa TaxID=3483 RepID=UPI0029CA4B3F|nr:U11/U12 small nuclear ribonucleoprotein 65 kDa protein [Cannabis sativa]